jgi:predicted transcriptional regulator
VSASSPAGFGMPGEAPNQGRRSPLEMACDILRALSEGPAKPTHILHKANMSWSVLTLHLDYLYGQGLIDRTDQGRKRFEYKLTQKGRAILQLYEGLKLSISGEANVYPTRDAFPLVERLPLKNGKSLPWVW